MKINPFFSIITVCLNSEKLLESTILSVANQECKDYEYIIIDGGSNDKTLDIIKKYEPHIDKWKSENDKGIYDAMNKGIELSKGKYLLFLNSGDLLYNDNILRKISEDLVNKKNIGICYGKAEYLNYQLGMSKYRGEKIEFNNLWEGMPFCHQAFFFNKQLFDLLGLYDLDYRICADYEFLYRYFINKQKYNFGDEFIDLLISKYLGGGISTQNILLVLEEVESINKKYINLNIKKRIYYKYRKFTTILNKYFPKICYFYRVFKNNILKSHSYHN